MEKLNKSKEQDEVEKDCCICYEIMVEPIRLQCKHRFCASCLMQAANNGNFCPLCKAKHYLQFKKSEIDVPFQKLIAQTHIAEFDKRH